MDYLRAAIEAAARAGKVHNHYSRRGFKIRYKSASFDLLTAADTQAEKAAVSFIRSKFPEHNFLCEEKRYRKTVSDYTWVIDPLDGTNNFASNLPIYCASVALKHKDEIIAAAVYDANRNEMFYAAKGRGSYLNGNPIKVNEIGRLKDALLITGFYYSRDKEMVATLETMKRFLFKHILGIRRLGAAALDLCYVACGRAAGFWEFELSPWDFCAGKLIVEEAGGRVTDNSGKPAPLTEKGFIVASNSRLHGRMLRIISQA